MENADRAHRHLLLEYLRDERGRAFGLAVLLVVSQAVPLGGPLIIKRFVDRATAGALLAELVTLAVLYLVVAVVAQGASVVVTWAGTQLAWRVTDRIRADAARHALSLDLAWHGQHNPGELIERIDGDITKMSEFYARVVLQVVAAGLLLVGVLVIVWAQDWRAGAIVTAFVAVAVTVVRRVHDLAVPAATVERAASADLFGGIEERAAGLEDLRANGGAPHVLTRFQEASATTYRASIGAERASSLVLVATHGTFAAGTALTLATGVWLYQGGAISIGAVFLLLQSTQVLKRALMLIAEQLRQLQKAGAGAARVADVLRVQPTVAEPDRPTALPSGPLDVRFENVTLSYPGGTEALRDVSFEIPAGSVLGVVGRTGSGKTTIARALVRFYDVDSGSVRVGGVDVRDVALAQLRTAVGLVTQDVQLFETSLRDNLTLFDGDGDGDDADARLINVLDALDLGDWFQRLPDGLDTVLGPGGSGVSAGEAQLLAFARVFLRDPGVVILDEATSRLDPVTEERIDRAVRTLLEGRTGVVIAHRPKTLEAADDVLTLDTGRLRART